MKKVLITGSAGLIGSESAKFFAALGFEIHGIDNNMREYFFGPNASTEWSKRNLEDTLKTAYKHYAIDVREYQLLEKIFKKKQI